ncbi:MAG: hypothetical protein ACT4QA_17485 [Panacagrimonas sp.]
MSNSSAKFGAGTCRTSWSPLGARRTPSPLATFAVAINGVQIRYDPVAKRCAAVDLTNEEPKFIEHCWEENSAYLMPY